MRATESDVEFDESGLITARNLVNTIHYLYDSDGNLTKKRIVSATGFASTQTVHYETPEDGNAIVRWNSGDVTVTSHSKTDSFGRKVFDELQIAKGFVSRRFSYHAGEPTEEHRNSDKLKSSATTQLVSQIVLSDGRTLSYEYDAEERITKVTDSVEGITEYTYDALGQLLTEKHMAVGEEAFTDVNVMTYDGYGNIRSKNGVTYTYGNLRWKDRLSKVGGQTISYDLQGNPTTYLGHTLTWEKGRQLKTFDNNTYTYNANGIRTSKTVEGVKHTYVLDGAKILREEWDGNVMTVTYDNEDSVCGIVFNDTPFYFLKNLQGDVIAIINEYGDTVCRYTYDAWGKCTVIANEGVGIGNINPFRYRGYYYDREIGLYYVSSRYYDPEIGRFISADEPMLLAFGGGKFGHNLFSYCENNPINQKDTNGYIAANIVGAAIGAIIGVVGGVFLGNWLADVLKLSGWKRGIFVAAVAALVGAAAGAIGYFIGPYVAKIAVKLAQYISNLISKGKIAFKNLSSSMRSSMKTLLKQTCCFVAGTKVLAKDGHISIEEIRTGDLVWAENPVTGEKDLKAVVRIIKKKTDTLVYVSTENEKIVTTKEHPFWVVDKGWVVAGRLSKDDVLLLQNGSTTKVISTMVEHIVEPIYVYNFEVQDWHTYYVSESNILVHNANCVQKFSRKSASDIERMLGVKSGTFHRTIKPKILKKAGKDVLKKVGSNPDILIGRDYSVGFYI